MESGLEGTDAPDWDFNDHGYGSRFYFRFACLGPVSYTHLTLPTILLV